MDWKNFLLKSMNDIVYNHLCYYYLHLKKGVIPKRLNLKNPSTFNEKTIWLKLNKRYANAHILVDKVAVKEYVKKIIGEKYIIPTIAVYDDVTKIEIDKLPSSFVLKANHGSGWNIICEDKNKHDFENTKKKLNRWMHTNYYDIGKEYQYRKIVPKIICETYLKGLKENPLVDYKIFCFSGKPMFIQVDHDRFTNHTRNFYDINWNIMPFTTLYTMGNKPLLKPESLDEMLVIAEKLSYKMIFVRIDLYCLNNSIYFGEITLHHGGGFEPFIPPEYDKILGKYIKILPIASD